MLSKDSEPFLNTISFSKRQSQDRKPLAGNNFSYQKQVKVYYRQNKWHSRVLETIKVLEKFIPKLIMCQLAPKTKNRELCPPVLELYFYHGPEKLATPPSLGIVTTLSPMRFSLRPPSFLVLTSLISYVELFAAENSCMSQLLCISQTLVQKFHSLIRSFVLEKVKSRLMCLRI